jgi:ABC-type protease/lipase transport system fused ATPase/permease subunit
MIDESNLRDVLTGLAMETRSAFVMSAAVLNELTALRETVRGLDPTFADVIEQKRKEAEARGSVEVARVLAGIDEMIERLKNGYVC